MKDKINQILNSLPEEEFQEEYMYKRNLMEKGVTISELAEQAEEIIHLWDETFAKEINEDTKKEIHYEQFKWHLFSYEKKKCLEDEDARKGFDGVPKDELYVMYQNSPVMYLYKNANKVEAKDFDSQQDIYIFNRDLTWTYVHTHESSCGPYFYRIG